MIGRLVLGAAILVAAGAPPALASGEIACQGEGVSIDMLVGRLPVLSVLRAAVTIGERTWSTDPDVLPGEPIAIGQAYEDGTVLMVDFTDDNVEEIVGRLRAFALSEGSDWISAGVFAMKEAGVFAVDCSLRG